jgi:hypothetical protein
MTRQGQMLKIIRSVICVSASGQTLVSYFHYLKIKQLNEKLVDSLVVVVFRIQEEFYFFHINA